jgi:hypothetical protein
MMTVVVEIVLLVIVVTDVAIITSLSCMISSPSCSGRKEGKKKRKGQK